MHFAAWKRTFDEFLQRYDPGAAGVQPARLQPLRRRQAPGRRRPRLPRQPGHHRCPRAAPDDPLGRGDRAGDRDPQERAWCCASSRSTASRSTPARSATCARCKDAGLRHRRGHRLGQRREGHRRRRASPTSSTSGSTASSPARDGLRGKPEPDTFLAGARALGVEPAAGGGLRGRALRRRSRAGPGNFGYVVGVDRVGQADALNASTAPTSSSPTSTELLGETAHDRGAGRRSRSSRGR